jgi:ribonuclease E
MNTRCYRCGRSFTIGREEIEAAAVASAGQKFHVVYCPNCRTAIKMPMEQVMRELPPGWQPPAPTAPATEAIAEAPAEAATKPGSEIVAVVVGVHKSHRRHRHAKSPEAPAGVSEVVPIFLAEPPTEAEVLEALAAGPEAPAPKRPKSSSAVKKTTRAAKKSTTAAKKTGAAAKKSAPAAKKTTRKRATSKK